jgi:hypothetical protein
MEPGASAMCPYCRNVVVVPADAQVAAKPGAGGQKAGGAEDGEQAEPEVESSAAVAFVAAYLPSWGTSVALHLAVLLVALTLGAAHVTPPPKVEYQTETVTKDVKHFLKEEIRTAEKSRTTRKAVSNQVSQFAMKLTDNPVPDVANNGLKTVEVIGVGGGGNIFGGMPGTGTGRGGGAGEGVNFFGTGGVAKKIVFVVDHSGSMTDSIVYVKHELKRSIRSLRPNQSFWLTFYSSGPTLDLPTAGHKLVPATEPNKAQAFDFIDTIIAIGQTDPSDSLKKAFECQPELIYILTDGEFDPGIAGLIERLNSGKDKVTINTICFIYSEGEPLLKKIAVANNGAYKFVGEDDVKKLVQ